MEIIPQAIEDARENARRNGIENVEFFVGKAEEVLPEQYERNHVHADVIVVDPPRKGCDPVCLETILKMAPERVVYVSCDSATLARDVKFLEENGYTYPVVMDETGTLFYQYGISAYPTTFMIDTEGNVFGYVQGAVSREVMDDIVEQTRTGQRR